VRTSEWVTLAYFAYLLATAAVLRVPRRTVLHVATLALLVAAIIALVARADPSPIATVLRDWFPGGYLLIGYWATGLLYRGPSRALETRLASIDDRMLATLRPLLGRMPSLVPELLESAYLLCYPLVPAGLAVLYLIGEHARADRYWVLVLVATFSAYGVLPWVGTRPPRALGSRHWFAPRPLLMARINLAVLRHGSIQVNTFPSGHAASAWAAALFLTTVPGVFWLVFMAIASGIAAGAVAGRYHYAVDVGAGVAAALVAFALVM
jgi:membrane-associated phospholipid phosphatase